MTLVLVIVIAGCESRGGPSPATPSIEVRADGVTLYTDTLGPTCATCSIRLEPLALIGRLHDPILFQRFPKVIRNTRGEYVTAVAHVAGHEVAVFDSAGAFLRTIGSVGKGPGEFASVTDIALGVDDTLFVAHDRNAVSVFDPEGEYVRQITTQLGTSVDLILPLRDVYVVNAGIRSADLEGVPLHLLDRDAAYIRSFGDVNIAGPRASSGRVLGRGRGATLWVAQDDQYKLDELDLVGRTLRVIGVATPKSWYSVTYMSLEEYRTAMSEAVVIEASPPTAANVEAWPPPFRVSGLYDNGAGLLFVSLRVPSPDWELVEPEYENTEYDYVRTTEATLARQYRTIIDVIAIETGEVRARAELSGYAYLSDDGTLVRIGVTEQGLIQVETFAVRFTE